MNYEKQMLVFKNLLKVYLKELLKVNVSIQ